jgi:photosystem II stability/assembly factor-like uncharacterized protein
LYCRLDHNRRPPRTAQAAIETEGAVEAARQQFFIDRLTSNTMKDVNEIQRRAFEAYQNSNRSSSFKSSATSDWTPISPNSNAHVCGRLRSIIFDPSNSKICYVAAAQGGIWKTTDISANPVHWTYLSSKFPTLTFGALAIDPHNGNVIYAGTGETHPGFVKTSGFGIYKSTDAGLNWRHIADQNIIGPSVAAIAIDPQNSNKIFVATGSASGLMLSLDAGATWVANLDATAVAMPFRPICVFIDPINTSNVAISTEEGAILRTTDGGSHWQFSINGLPLDSVGTTTIAMAASNPATLYASIGKLTTNTLLGVWKTENFGQSWFQVNDGRDFNMADTNVLGGQAFYANTIAVNPTNPDEFVIAGLNTYFSTNGGAFRNGSAWEADPTDPRYSHADVHYALYNGNDVYLCTDGGLSVTNNRGLSWNTALSNGIDAFQFIGIDAPKSFNYVIGGLQDNGVQQTTTLTGNWAQTRGGDGGLTRCPTLTPKTVFSTFYNPTLTRSEDEGRHWVNGSNGNIQLVTNPLFLAEKSLFYAPMDVSSDGKIVAMGGLLHVYVSFNGGDDGMAQQSNSILGVTHYLYINPKNSAEIWAGTEKGIAVSTNYGLDWSVALAIQSTIVGIVKSPVTGEIFAISEGMTSDQRFSFGASTDGGNNWFNPAQSGIPQIPFNSITVSNDGTLFIGTDYNVISSTDNGASWQPVGLELPPVQVLSLQVRGDSDQYLLAGTHGRGAWYFPLKKSSSTPLNTNGGNGNSFQLLPPFPNPIPENSPLVTTIEYIFEKPRDYTLKLYDAAGSEMQIISAGFEGAGTHDISFSESGLAAGEYFIALASYGVVLMQKMVIFRPN